MARLIPVRVARAAALGRYRTGLVEDVGTGSIIWNYGSGLPMRGASTTKLATAVTALRLLGTTTRFPTRIVAGRTDHELVLVAGGDPLLTSAQLRVLARSTALALLPLVPAATTPAPATPRRVSFTLRVDDTLYPAPTYATGWPADYEPSVVTPVRPLVRDLRNGWDTSKDVASYVAARMNAELTVLLAARTDLAPAVTYTGRLRAPASSREIARFAGNTSAAVLAYMLLVSDNDVAEMMFRNSAIAAGRGGSWYAARVTEVKELRRLGIDIRGWALFDGSGVSRSDRLTSRGLVNLLRVAQSPAHPELAPLLGWLPVGGVSGTLAPHDKRFTTAPTRCARGKVFAKTGTLHDTIGLAGYARGSDGRLRAFAVLVNAVDPRFTKLQVRQAVDLVPATATGCF